MKRDFENRFFVEFYVDDDLKKKIVRACKTIPTAMLYMDPRRPPLEVEERFLRAVFESKAVRDAVEKQIQQAKETVIEQYVSDLETEQRKYLGKVDDLQEKIDEALAKAHETD